MHKLAIIEKIFTGKNVSFSKGEITSGSKKGNKIIIIKDEDLNKNFVLKASIKNFTRFQKWIDKKAVADYEPSFIAIPTNLGRLPVVYISTEVEIDNEGNEYKDNQYDNLGVNKDVKN